MAGVTVPGFILWDYGLPTHRTLRFGLVDLGEAL